MVVFVFQDLHAFAHARVVEADAPDGGGLRGLPVARLEIALGVLAGLAEQPVMLVEAVQHGARDIERDLGRQQLGEGWMHVQSPN